MRLDDLSDAFEAFADRARNVIGWEVDKAKKVVVALNAEKAAAQKTITELHDQYAAARKQLDDVLSNLDKGTTVATLARDITEGRKTLEKLKADTEKATAAFEAVEKQRKNAERELNTANSAMQGIRQERINATTDIEHIRKLLKSVA
jgi:chromosome segregation ATPase